MPVDSIRMEYMRVYRYIHIYICVCMSVKDMKYKKYTVCNMYINPIISIEHLHGVFFSTP